MREAFDDALVSGWAGNQACVATAFADRQQGLISE
jgi:hypothetical protein